LFIEPELPQTTAKDPKTEKKPAVEQHEDEEEEAPFNFAHTALFYFFFF
jgi:hypothetical protein